jgi:HprK-related kinase A
LTAALATRGFRLLSDEFGVVRTSDGALLPLLRPVALKNESIDVIRSFAPQARIGPRYPKTRKGTVAHMAPDEDAVARRHEPATPALIVFPRYDPDVALDLTPEKPSRAFGRLAVNSFNYEMLGPVAFDAVARLVRSNRIYSLTYGDLERAVGALRELVAHAG